MLIPKYHPNGILNDELTAAPESPPNGGIFGGPQAVVLTLLFPWLYNYQYD